MTIRSSWYVHGCLYREHAASDNGMDMRISDGMIVRYEEHETPAWHRAKEDPKTSLRSSVSSEIQIQKFEMIHLPPTLFIKQNHVVVNVN